MSIAAPLATVPVQSSTAGSVSSVQLKDAASGEPFAYVAPSAGDTIVIVGGVVSAGAVCATAAAGSAAKAAATPSTPAHGLFICFDPSLGDPKPGADYRVGAGFSQRTFVECPTGWSWTG